MHFPVCGRCGRCQHRSDSWCYTNILLNEHCFRTGLVLLALAVVVVAMLLGWLRTFRQGHQGIAKDCYWYPPWKPWGQPDSRMARWSHLSEMPKKNNHWIKRFLCIYFLLEREGMAKKKIGDLCPKKQWFGQSVGGSQREQKTWKHRHNKLCTYLREQLDNKASHFVCCMHRWYRLRPSKTKHREQLHTAVGSAIGTNKVSWQPGGLLFFPLTWWFCNWKNLPLRFWFFESRVFFEIF